MAASREVFRDNLQRLLEKNGISQSELARACEWPPARINEILHLDRTYTLDKVDAIAAALSQVLKQTVSSADLLRPFGQKKTA